MLGSVSVLKSPFTINICLLSPISCDWLCRFSEDPRKMESCLQCIKYIHYFCADVGTLPGRRLQHACFLVRSASISVLFFVDGKNPVY